MQHKLCSIKCFQCTGDDFLLRFIVKEKHWPLKSNYPFLNVGICNNGNKASFKMIALYFFNGQFVIFAEKATLYESRVISQKKTESTFSRNRNLTAHQWETF